MAKKKNTNKKQDESEILKGVQKLEGFEEPCEPWIHTAGNSDGPDCIPFGNWEFNVGQWAAVATPHALTPRMTEDEFEALRQSIRLEGVLDTIFLNQQGIVLDGFHRLKGWWLEDMIGRIDPPRFEILRFQSKEAETHFVLMKNLTRRHLSINQRRQVAESLLRNKHSGTDGHIGALCGLNSQTVKRIRKALESTAVEEGGIEVLSVRTSKRGKKYKQVETQAGNEDQMAIVGEPPCMDGGDKKVEEDTTCGTQVNTDVGQFTGEDEGASTDLSTPEHGILDSIESCLDASPQVRLETFLEKLVAEWWARHGLRPVLTGDLYKIVQEMTGPASLLMGGSESKRKNDFVELISGLDNSRYCDRLVFVTKLGNSKVFSLSPKGWKVSH